MSDIETKTALDGDTASSPISAIMTDETPQKTQADVTDEDRKRAELYKSEGNQLWAEHHYQQAIDAYTKAIELDPFNAVYYSNRAMCHMKLENYGLALADGSKSIECDASYIKGYYRRGAAYLAMGKYKDGLKDFKHVAKIKPNDKDAQTKLKECQKAVRAEAFNAAIENEKSKPASELYDYKTIDVESSYDGPRYDEPSDLNPTFIQQLLDHFKAQKRLHRKYVYRIVLEAIKLLSSLPTLIEIDIPENDQLTVCGDVHGQFYDLLNIFAINGIPSEKNPYLFNGDFVDRGSFSLEIIVSFFALKLLYPTRFHLLRGNHESLTMNQIYGFQGEVQSKVDGNCFALFSECFNYLPLAAVIGEKVLVVHGGLFSEDGVKLEDIKKINRNCQPPEKGLMCELMWSDPQPQKGRAPSKRGVGLSFGPDVTHRFLKDNKLDLIVRSHEVKEEGYQVEADGKLITVFSAPNYCDSMGNKGAFIKFGPSLKPEFTKFTAVPHPAVQPMAYASSMFRM